MVSATTSKRCPPWVLRQSVWWRLEAAHRGPGRSVRIFTLPGVFQPRSDARLLAALAHGLPACAGVALGVDRLLMAMLGGDRIGDVLAFGFASA